MNRHQVEFLQTGAKTYLDVHLAMKAFRELVWAECETVVREKLDQINTACQMQWMLSSVKDYVYHQSSPRIGVSLGKKILIKDAGAQGGLYFHLRLVRAANNPGQESLSYEVGVQLYRGSQDVLDGLWANSGHAALDETFEKTHDGLLFKRALTEDGLRDLGKHLAQATDDLIIFMRRVGGLKRFLPASTQE
jgi:hypothetical protein